MTKPKYRKILVYATIISAFLLSGCGLLGGEKKEEIDPPKEVTMTNEEQESVGKTVKEETKKGEKEAAAESTVKTELYLLDKNGLVVSANFESAENGIGGKTSIAALSGKWTCY